MITVRHASIAALVLSFATPFVSAHASAPYAAPAMERLNGTYVAAEGQALYDCGKRSIIHARIVGERLEYTIEGDVIVAPEEAPRTYVAYSDKDKDTRVSYGIIHNTEQPFLQTSSSSFDHGGDGFNGDIVGWSKYTARFVGSANGQTLTVTKSSHEMGLMTYSDTGGEHLIQNERHAKVCHYVRASE